jgi:hypothetical protein
LFLGYDFEMELRLRMNEGVHRGLGGLGHWPGASGNLPLASGGVNPKVKASRLPRAGRASGPCHQNHGTAVVGSSHYQLRCLIRTYLITLTLE